MVWVNFIFLWFRSLSTIRVPGSINVGSTSTGIGADWRVRIVGMVGGAVGAAVALFVLKPLVELPFWLGLIAFVVMAVVGGVLGRFAGGLLFRQ
jgi:hypothetical protein